MAKKKAAKKPKRSKPKARSRRTDSTEAKRDAYLAGDAKSRKVNRSDGWKNAITGLGTNKDVRTGSVYVRDKKIGDNQLTAIWRANGFGRRVIDVIPDDVFRNWFKVTNDEGDKVKQKLEELRAQPKLKRAAKLARCYGGAIVLMGINDGGKLEDPVNPDKIKSVDFLLTFDRREVTIQTTDVERDIMSGNFGQPRIYEIIPRFGSATIPNTTPGVAANTAGANIGPGGRFRVHSSRVIRFDGAEIGWREYEQNAYWMDSVLEFVYEHIRQLGAVYDSSEFIVNDFVQTTIKIKNLLEMIAGGQDALLKQRLNYLDMSRSVANSILLDAEEEYVKHASSVAGLHQLLDKFMVALSAVTGIPVTRLFGRAPAGLNATGEGDLTNYYDDIRSAQANDYGPRIEPLVSYIWASQGFTEPDAWSLKWNQLHIPTPEEEGQQYKATAEGDTLYINAQVLDPEFVARKRFVGDHFEYEPISMTQEEFDEMNGAMEAEEAERAERARLLAEQTSPTLPDGSPNPNFKQGGAPPAAAGDKPPPDGEEIDEDE